MVCAAFSLTLLKKKQNTAITDMYIYGYLYKHAG